MPANSFRRDLTIAPPSYRTPSPPSHLFEPLSPGTAAWSETWSQPLQRFAQSVGPNKRPCQTNENTQNVNNRNGDLVNTDEFGVENSAAGSHSKHSDNLLSSRAGPNTAVDEHQIKRARNKKSESLAIHNAGSRPGTGHAQDSETMRFDAELLLNFSREACSKARSYSMSSSTAPPYQMRNLSIPHEETTSTNAALPSFEVDAAGSDHGISDAHQTLDKDQDQAFEQASGLSQGVESINGFGHQTSASVVVTDSASQDQSAPTSQAIGDDGSSEELYNDQRSREELKAQTDEAVHATVGAAQEQAPVAASVGEPNNHQSNNDTNSEPMSKFLDGLEEAARVGMPTLEDSMQITEGKIEDLKVAGPKQKQDESPSVCAACNFTRDSLTAEIENDATSWICCDGCKSWFHFACAGFKNGREVRGVDKYRCRKCKPIHGPTTFVRKSARAHSAIDYAGLNEGIVKSSDENPEHHYIKPIKEGTIKFDQENFARMRPELVTADYFQKGDGMKEPIVIPAEFNPSPRHIPGSSAESGEPQEQEPGQEQDLEGLNDVSALDSWLSEGWEYEQVPDHGQDGLGMVIPRDLTVRKVSEMYGPEEKIEVIDVKSQNGEDKKWNMRRWVDYYEAQGSKPVRNVISLEVSQSKLGRLIRRPQVVRDLDLQDSVWPAEMLAKGDFPKVQFYCLMSVADCFTDFHIDFGGSSVYYHILKGKKTFFFIPPHEKHLKKYEEWCNSPAQNWTFLGDQTKECYRVDLSEGDTMLIPAGWIHAVWTPEDSLVIGGNFLTRMHYSMQIRVTQIEKATHVARKFRYPHFQKVMWYSALRYLEDDPLPETVRESLGQGQPFKRDIPTYLDFDGHGLDSTPGAENYHARYYSKAELDGLVDLGRYLHRTAMIALGYLTDGITTELRNAVKRSIPKGCTEPLETLKKFATWYSWKRGNETLPHWAYPDWVPDTNAVDSAEKKLSAKAIKRLDREAALQAWKVAPDRQSTRTRTQPSNLLNEMVNGQSSSTNSPKSSTPVAGESNSSSLKRKAEDNSPQAGTPQGASPSAKKPRTSSGTKPPSNRRPACEACRKGRRACKHRDDPPALIPGAQLAEAQGSIEVTSTPTKTNPNLTTTPMTSDGTALMSNSSEIQLTNSVTTNGDSLRPGSKSGPYMADIHIGKFVTPSQPGDALHTPSKSSGRSKACKDCRKSKRRCVHDEFGNEDPAKLEQAIIPRPAAKKKRPSGDNVEPSSSKKLKKTSNAAQGDDLAPADDLQQDAPPEVDATEAPVEHVYESVIDPRLEAMTGMDIEMPDAGTKIEEEQAEDVNDQDAHTLPSSAFNPEDEVNLIATSPYFDVKVEHPLEQEGLSSHSDTTHQVTSSLVSPPESTHTDGEQSPPAAEKSKGFTPPVTGDSSRHSSRPAKNVQRYTPESSSVRRASFDTAGRPNGRDSTSPAVSVGQTPMHKRKTSRMNSQSDVDEESLTLIRELQAQDMGLRRRARGS